jgi:hypothetical protein
MDESMAIADQAAELIEAGEFSKAYDALTSAIAAHPDGAGLDPDQGWPYIWLGMQMLLTLLQTANRLA